MLALHSVKKLCICGINPVPVLRILSQNVEHCAVSTLAIALEHHPELVRSVSMGPCSTASTPQGTLVHTQCAWYPSTCSRSVCSTFLYYVIVCVGQVYATVQCLLIGSRCHLHIFFSPCTDVQCRGLVCLTCWPSARVSEPLSCT